MLSMESYDNKRKKEKLTTHYQQIIESNNNHESKERNKKSKIQSSVDAARKRGPTAYDPSAPTTLAFFRGPFRAFIIY